MVHKNRHTNHGIELGANKVIQSHEWTCRGSVMSIGVHSSGFSRNKGFNVTLLIMSSLVTSTRPSSQPSIHITKVIFTVSTLFLLCSELLNLKFCFLRSSSFLWLLSCKSRGSICSALTCPYLSLSSLFSLIHSAQSSRGIFFKSPFLSQATLSSMSQKSLPSLYCLLIRYTHFFSSPQ